jgi:cyclic pyranopterin phosphate synthase
MHGIGNMFKQIDISKKGTVYREAEATGRIILSKETLERIKEGKIEKGNPISLAELSSINGAKLTPQIIILCHHIKIEKVEPIVKVEEDSVVVNVVVGSHEKTGVEMEALMAVTSALLNIWDAVKKYEKDSKGQYPHTKIMDIRVVRKVKKKNGTHKA